MADDLYPIRVRFTDGQFLQAADLTDEQTYHLLMRWRHNLGLHSWGILAGLNVLSPTVVGGKLTVTVTSGMALDGYGREIVLAQDNPVSITNDYNAVFDVLIRYNRRCPDPSRANGPRSLNRCPPPRYTEEPYISLVLTSSRESSDPARPGEVPEGDLDFTADRLPPDDPNRPWPVLLGRLSYQDGKWVVDTSVRRYAGLVADRIEAPVRGDPSDAANPLPRTVLYNGSDPDSAYRFAVVSAGAGQSTDPDATPPLIGVRALEGTGNQIEFRSERVSVAADMVFTNGSVMEFQSNPVGSEGIHAGAVSGNGQWRIYHHFEPPKVPTSPSTRGTGPSSSTAGGTSGTGTAPPAAGGGTAASPPAPGFSDELRITMPASTSSQVAIGCFDDKGKFSPVLAVKGDGSVSVYGKLTVTGVITGRIADAPAGQAGVVAVPTPAQLVEAAIPALRQGLGLTTGQLQRVLEAVAATSNGKDAIKQFVPTNAALNDDDRTQLLARLWGLDRGPLIAKSTADTSTASEPLGARAGNFTDFLNALPDAFRPDSGTTTVAPAKVIGEWLCGLPTGKADPLANLDLTSATDAAVGGIAAAVAKGPPLRLTTLIHQLIDNGAADEMISQLVTNRADQVAEKLAQDKPSNAVDKLLSKNPQVIGSRFPTDDTTLGLILEGLFEGSTTTTIAPRAKTLAAALMDHPSKVDDVANVDPAKNFGNKAVALAFDDVSLPQNPTSVDQIPTTIRLRRFLTYLLLSSDADLKDRLKRSFQFFTAHPALPPPPGP